MTADGNRNCEATEVMFSWPTSNMTTLDRLSSLSDTALSEVERLDIIPTVKGALDEMFQLRATVTAMVVAWGAWITWRLYRSNVAEGEDEKILRMHQIWFGGRPLGEMLVNAWATSIVVAIVVRAATKWFRGDL
jgi:steroid 5-alpha reductase family enzyme